MGRLLDNVWWLPLTAGGTMCIMGRVDQLVRDVKTEVCKLPEVAAVWIFGSVARGEGREDSDLDVAVLLRPEASPNARQDLYDLAARLERFSPSGRVDMVVLGEQGPVFRHRVLREGKLVCDAAPELRVAFEGRTIAEYLDWKPTHDIAMQVAFKGLRDRFARGAG